MAEYMRKSELLEKGSECDTDVDGDPDSWVTDYSEDEIEFRQVHLPEFRQIAHLPQFSSPVAHRRQVTKIENRKNRLIEYRRQSENEKGRGVLVTIGPAGPIMHASINA